MPTDPAPMLLVFPPVFEPEHPYLALPALAAALRARAIPVIVRDLNLAAHEVALGADFLQQCETRVEAAIAELEARPTLAPEDQERYEALVVAATAGPGLPLRLPEAIAALREGDASFDRWTYDASMRAVLQGFALISAAYWPLRLSYGNAELPGLKWSAQGLLDAAARTEGNVFADLYAHGGLLDDLADAAEGAAGLGISVIDSEQLVPALTLARLLRERVEGLRVVLGGPYLTKLVPELEASPELFDVVDAVIVGEGETPLTRLWEVWTGGGELAEVPNLVWRDGEGAVHANRPFGVETVGSLPAPDFSDLPLDRYWSPEPVLPILAARGCYWGRCTFCAHSYIYRRRFERREAERVVEEMRTQTERHGVRAFFFSDESLSPGFVRKLSALIKERLPQAVWGGEVRFERGFTRETLADAHEAGLRLLVFGLESFDERVLKLMQKGIQRETIRRITADCVDVGIAVHMWAIAGFPTETRAEAEETLDFLFGDRRLAHSPDYSIGLNRFALTRHCPVELNPEEYEVTLHPRTPAEAFLTVSRYDCAAGMSEDELDEVFRRFDALERQLPLDVRRTGRVYHLLRRDAGYEQTAPPPSPDEPDQLAVRRTHFDMATLHDRTTSGAAPSPLPALPRPLPTLGYLLVEGRNVLLKGGMRDAIDGGMGELGFAVIRLPR